MNRIDRLTAIILLLQGGRRTASEIARRFEVSRRTVFRDIEALGEIGVPIVTEAGAHGGYTLMPDQHHQDTDQLLQTIQLDIPARTYATPFIEQLIESARTGQWLCVSYRSGKGTSQQTILPHRLYSAGGFWYCEAYSQERQEERTYRVDRFAGVSATQAPEHIAPMHHPLPYEHPSHQEVRIRLTARGVLVMERDPQLGDAIQPVGAEGGLLCFRCPPTEYDWLIHTLLSLGPDAEVLAPDELRDLVRQAAQDIAKRYTQ
jgi:predicted DNA-binding transcriptional regulator YafY